jgi:hypothetical protein
VARWPKAKLKISLHMRPIALLLITLVVCTTTTAQTNWNKDGNSYTTIEDNSIVEITLPAMTKTTLVSADQLAPLGIRQREGNRTPGDGPGTRTGAGTGARRGFGGGAFQYQLSDEKQKVLIFTKPARL